MVLYIITCVIGCITRRKRLRAGVAAWFARCVFWWSHACERLPRTAENLVRDIYNYFCHSAKRQEEFKDVQSFCNVEPHKLLRPCQTRWLSLHPCISRVIEQLEALEEYFKAVANEDKLLSSNKILSLLQNPLWKLYFYFLDFVLPEFTQLNVMFQSSKTSVHCLHVGLLAIYREFLSCYLSEAYWKKTPLKDIDPTSQVNLLPLPKMYMGAMVTLSLAKEEYKQLRSTDIHHFLKCVQDFFIEAASQIKGRFPIGDPIIEMLQVLVLVLATPSSRHWFPWLLHSLTWYHSPSPKC